MISGVTFGAERQIRRAKSASSVPRHRQAPSMQLDPEIAKRHAMAAASRAMQRASERSSNESRGSWEYAGGAEKTSMPGGLRSASLTANNTVEDSSIAAVLPSIDDFQGIGGGDCSTPSSYRRLRKAKSMFSTRRRTGNMNLKESTSTEPDISQQGDPLGQPPAHQSIKRSFSFFRSGSQSSQALQRTRSQDAAVQLARSQFSKTQETFEPQERHQSVFARARREQKAFRKTVRTSKDVIPVDDMTPPRSEQSTNAGFQMKARSFSNSVKNRLKRVFGHPKGTDDRSPDQGISGSHFANYVTNDFGTEPDCKSYGQHHGGCDAFLDYANRPRTDENHHPTIRTKRSSESICTTNSRVTSWTDSSTTNTITTRHPLDQNRLSIISEHGDSNQASSDSVNGHNRRTYNAFSKPLKARPSARKLDGTVDTQRVYSALMRRIDQAAGQKEEGTVLIGTVRCGQPVPERASSIRSQYSNPSIRRIPSDLSMKTAQTSLVPDLRPKRSESRLSLQSASAVDNHLLNSMEVAHHNESSPRRRQSKAAFWDPESTFFPRTSYCKPKTPSPYRLALSSKHRIDDNLDEDSASVIISKSIAECPSDSPSVYSRTPSGEFSGQESRAFLDALEWRERGMATIFSNQRTSYRSPRKVAGSISSRNAMRPSSEWKAWVHSEVARIEDSESIRSPNGRLAREHYREDTQIHDGDLQGESPEICLPTTIGEKRGRNLTNLTGLTSLPYGSGPLVELTGPKPNNFSRPLCCPSSAVIVSATPNTPIDQSPLNSSPESDTLSGASQSFHPLRRSSTLMPSSDHSLMHSKSNASIRYPESPTPRRGSTVKGEASSPRRYPMPDSSRQVFGTGSAKAVPFRSIRGNGRVTDENARTPRTFHDFNESEKYSQLQGLHSTISSKRMVEIFLDSRRIPRETSEQNVNDSVFL
ncbi:hypothetical protein V8E54_014855 [Elaphomyces granulatus]